MLEYLIFLRGLAQQWGCDRNEIWLKGHLGGEDDALTSNTRIARACAEKACDTTLNDEKYNWSHTGAVSIDMTCVVVMALCNQPEVFALDLGDNQFRYLLECGTTKFGIACAQFSQIVL